MNDSQKVGLVVVMVAIAAMLLFPPFHFRGADGIVINLGYGFLFSPPTIGSDSAGTVDIGMLITQWLGVVVIGGIAFFMLDEK